MSGTIQNRKVTGLSAEKWTIFKLRQMQLRLKEVAIADPRQQDEANATMKEVIALLHGQVSNVQLLTSPANADVVFDLLRAIAAFNFSAFNSNSEEHSALQVSTYSIAAAFFKQFSGVMLTEAGSTDSGEQTQHDGAAAVGEGSSVLGILTAIGALGLEDTMSMILSNLLKTVTHRFASYVGAASRSAEGKHPAAMSSAAVKRQMRFALSFLGFTQTVMHFHSNRKKLFTAFCEAVLPVLVTLLSFLDALAESSTAGGANPEDAEIIAECVEPLRAVLRSVVESGLFDDKAVEELATMRLQELAAAPAQSDRNDKKRTAVGAKKTKGGKEDAETSSIPVEDSEAQSGKRAAAGTGAGAGAGKNNKAFHDVLLRVLVARYYGSSDASTASAEHAGVAGAGREAMFAKGVAALLLLYADRSASIAAHASLQGQGQGQGQYSGNPARGASGAGYARNDAMNIDAVNTRKHLARVFHLTFLLLDAFQVPTSREEVLRTVADRLAASGASADAAQGQNGKRKRSQSSLSADASVPLTAAMADALRSQSVANEILSACVKALRQQAIPNHDSLYRYVDRFRALSIQAVKNALTAQTSLTGLSASIGDAGFVRGLLALDMHCIRIVAAIDHNTVVDKRLSEVIRVLSRTASEAKCTAGDGMVSAGHKLFRSVLDIHGELRLLDHLVGEGLTSEQEHLREAGGKGAAASSLLGQVLLSEETYAHLVSQLGAIPAGQGPLIWAHLAKSGSVGVVACCLARALIQAQLHTVRSNASVFLPQEGSASGESGTAVSPAITHAAALLWKLTLSLQAVVTSPPQVASGTIAAVFVPEVLRTLSALLRYVVHSTGGSAPQLLIAAVSTSDASSAATPDASLFHIAMNPLLNTLVALQRTAANSTAALTAALSLLLLCSNVTAKVAGAAAQFSAQEQVLRKFAVDLLSADTTALGAENVAKEQLVLDTLTTVLRDTRTWSQLSDARGNTADSLRLTAKHLQPLFTRFVAELSVSSAESQSGLALLSGLLRNASVSDNSLVKEALLAAVEQEWKAVKSAGAGKSASAVANLQRRATFISAVCRALPEKFLFTAGFFAPDLFAHVSEVLKLGADSSVLPADRQLLLDSAEVASSVLLGFARTVQFSRLVASDSIAAPQSAESKAVCVLNAILTCLCAPSAGPEGSQSILSSALGPLVSALPSLLQGVVRSAALGACPGHCEQWAALCLDTALSHALNQVDANDAEAPQLFAQVWGSVAALVKEASLGDQLHDRAAGSSVQLFVNTALNAILGCKSPACLAAVRSLLDELVAVSVTPAAAPAQKKAAKSAAKSDPVTTKRLNDKGFHFVAVLNSALTAAAKQSVDTKGGVSSAASLDDAQVASLVKALFSAAQQTAGQSTQLGEGWLQLFGSLAGPIVMQTGSVTLPSLGSSSGAADLSTQTAVVRLDRLQGLFQVLASVVSGAARHVGDGQTVRRPASLAAISLLGSVMQYLLRSRACNCETSEVLALFRTALLRPLMVPTGAADVCEPLGLSIAGDTLTYMTEYGRRLLSGGSQESTERFQRFHHDLTALVASEFQMFVSDATARDAASIERLSAALLGAHAVTLAATATLQRQGKSGARRSKQPKRDGDASRSTVFRFDVWFDGLLGTLSLAVSHLHVWTQHQASSSTGSKRSATASTEVATAAEEANAATVLLAKSVLVNLERLVAVSTASALPNLNSSVGVICSLLTSTITLLLSVEQHVSGPAGRQSAAALAQLPACYHLLCRVCGSIGSSAVLEKHIHFIASAVVESLSKITVSRMFQEMAYPGIYALFEKCQSRQKTQMFAMLDTQSRVLMTDLHNEFMRSFKFVGK